MRLQIKIFVFSKIKHNEKLNNKGNYNKKKNFSIIPLFHDIKN